MNMTNMTTKNKISIILIFLTMSSLLSTYGQNNNYPLFVRQDFDVDKIYSQHKDGKYIVPYIQYSRIPTYETATENRQRTEPLPWEMKKQPTGKVLELLTDRLAISEPEHAVEQNYIVCLTSVPETMGDMVRELLAVRLLNYKLVDTDGNDISIDINNGVSLIYSSLFDEDGASYQNIAVKMRLTDESNFSDIADGYINLSFDLATDFDKLTLDKSQRGKTFMFDGKQAELLEMEGNTVHLKQAVAEADCSDDWEFIPCYNGQPMGGGLSIAEYPLAFYDFARKNKGLSYADFEKEATTNEATWKSGVSYRVMTVYFDDCTVTSLYIYKPKCISVEKRIEIKGNKQ